MELYPYLLTYGGPQLFVLLVLFVVTPVIYRRYLKVRARRFRIMWLAGLWFGAVVIAYGDVFLIAWQAERLCREDAGLKVYRTLHAEGVLGGVSLRDLQDIGIKYVEWRTPMGRPTKRESYENGEYKYERINDFKSQVELAWQDLPRSNSIVESKTLLKERSSGNVLGEIIAFEFYPGWLDSRLLGLVGLSWAPPRCDDDYPPRQEKRIYYTNDLIRKTINPK